MDTKGYIRAELFIEQRCVRLHGLLHIDNSRQWLIIDLNQVASIASSVAIVRNYNCDGVSIKTHLAFGQWSVNTHPLGHFSKGSGYGNVPHNPFHVFCCVHCQNTRILTCSISVNLVNTRMSIRTTKYSHMEHTR